MDARLDRTVTSGPVTLEGNTIDVDNNVYVFGDRFTCIVIDAPHNLDLILQLVGDRILQGIICTHAHEDHVQLAPALARRTGAPILLHPADRFLWDSIHPKQSPHGILRDGQQIGIGRTTLEVIATPGHTPGSVCFWWPEEQLLFTGDTLPMGCRGATNEAAADHVIQVKSIRHRLLPLGNDVVVKPGHGPETTLGEQRPHFELHEG